MLNIANLSPKESFRFKTEFMMSKKVMPYITVISAMLLWSFSFIWSKIAFETYQPITVLFFRLAVATIALFAIGKLVNWFQKVKAKDYKWLLLLAFFEPFLYFIGENFGLKMVSAGTASIIISTIPLFLPIVAYLFYKEKISRFNTLGLFISLLGVMLIIWESNKGTAQTESQLSGFLLLFLAVFSALLYAVVLNKVTQMYNVFTIVLWQNIFSSIAFGILFLIFDFQSFISIGVLNKSFLYVIILGIFASNIAFILYTYSIRFFGVSKIGIFTNLIPIFTIISSFFILGESINAVKYIGIALVLIGLYVSERKRRVIRDS